MQDRYLGPMGSLWFNRTETADRKLVSERIKQHINNPANNRMLIFPEGVVPRRGAFPDAPQGRASTTSTA